MSNRIVIVDYGMGNLFSVRKKLVRLHADAVVSSSPSEIACADKIILPGVGHFQKAMENLVSLNLLETINESVLIKKKPILGICLGMQLMANKSEEGNVNGLGWFDADVVRFKVKDALKNKIPHMGWNQISIAKDNELMKGIPNLSEFYFVHSFHFKCYDSRDVLNVTDYDYSFVSAVQKENIFGVQYHPEKSHDVGTQLLKNYIDL
jgi:glutamine amidotransferase